MIRSIYGGRTGYNAHIPGRRRRENAVFHISKQCLSLPFGQRWERLDDTWLSRLGHTNKKEEIIMRKTRVCSLLLAIWMVLSLLPVPSLAANDSGVTVDIVSFADGRNTGLRDSELLVAKVEGYSGDVTKLTYKWTYTPSLPANTSPWPHLYIFNSQNMADTKSATINSGSKQGVGYMYASLSSHSSSKRTPSTSIKVEVYDGSTLLCDATYSGFVNGDLELDLTANAVGLFAGESVMARDLFGQMGVTHIICANSSVMDATLSRDANTYIQATQRHFESGQQHITDYEITGVSAGKATITLTVSKTSFCAFHEGQTANAEVAVYVFEKPTYTPTASEVTLGNTKSGYTYTIGGQSYTASEDNEEITFTGLEPNTSYQIIVSATYGDSNSAYAYVPATTKPLTRVSVTTLLDWVPATLDKINSLDGNGLPKSLKLTPVGGGDSVPLTYNPNWKNDMENMYVGYAYQGTYNLCDEKGTILSTSPLVVVNDVSGGVNHNFLSFFSVTTKVGDKEVGKIPYLAGSMVLAPAAPDNDLFPEDTVFSKWELTQGKADDIGKNYQPGAHVIANIQQPIVLEAQTVDEVKVTVNVRINYQAPDNLQVQGEAGYDHNYESNTDATVILWRSWTEGGTTRYEEVDRRECTDGEVVMVTNNVDEPAYTEYTDLAFIGLPAENPQGQEYTYSVTLGAKPNYDAKVEEMSQIPTGYKKGFDAILNFSPISFDLEFGVKVPKDLANILDAVDLKITYWNTTDSKGEVITQHETAGVTLTMDKTLTPDQDGNVTLTGTYPVWKHESGDPNKPYWYGLEIQGYRLKDEDGVTYSIVAGDGTPVSIVDEEDTIKVSDGGITRYDSTTEKQTENLIATLQGKPTTIKFDLNGGGTDTASMNDKQAYFMPDQKNLIPDSSIIQEGYVFQGWYTGSVCTTPAPAEGTLLYDVDTDEELTLYAKWAKPVSFNGTVTATHWYNGGEADPSDWLKTATVLLQRRVHLVDVTRGPEDGWETCDTQPVDLTTEGSTTVDGVEVATNSGGYNFGNIPSASPLSPYEYRVRVVAQNYDSDPQYTSQTTGVDKGVVAPVTEDSSYEINIGLPSMDPKSVELDYQIDVSQIGSAFRNGLGLENAYIGFNPTGGVPSYTIIKQMKDGAAITDLTFSDGTYSGTQSVWQVHTHGTLSRYQLGLGKVGIYDEDDNSLITEKLELEVDESLPYTIERAEEVYYNTETQ